MEQMQSLIGLVSDRVSDVAKGDVVVGEPLQVGEVTVVPLSRLSLGFGGGGGEGEGEPNGGKKHKGGKGSASGVGGGGKVCPVGVVVFTADGVEVRPIPRRKGVIDRVFDKVPEFVDLVKDVAAKHADD